MHNYTVVRSIGSGNFGSVSLVQQKSTGLTLVCKSVDLSTKSQQQQREAENEVKTMNTVDHPNIIGFIEAFVQRKILHIIMEYADAKDLEQLLLEHGRSGNALPEDQIVSIFTQMALGLRKLHQKRLLHRDLKSANVFLTSRGMVKLGDFGFSKQLSCTVALARTICGTPYYFSPELCQKMPYNHKSDVWSLGVVLYEMINLRKPYEAQNLSELRKRVIDEEPAPFSGTHVSEDLKGLCRTILSKSSKSRPSVDEILQTPIMRKNLSHLYSTFDAQESRARTAINAIKGQHPRRDNETVAVPKDPKMGDGRCKKVGKYNAADMKKMMKSEDAPSTDDGQQAAVRTLHNKELPDARSQISANAPITVITELSDLLVEERDCHAMKEKIQEALDAVEPTPLDDIGEAQSDEEKKLREELGEARFVKALHLVLQVKGEDQHFDRLMALLDGRSHLIGDLQRIASQFEIE